MEIENKTLNYLLIVVFIIILLGSFFIVKSFNLKDLIKDVIELLKVKSRGEYVTKKRRIIIYFIVPFFLSGIITYLTYKKISNEYIELMSTIITLLIGFLINALLILSGLIEKIKNKNQKKYNIIKNLYNGIVYELFISFIFLVSLLSLFFCTKLFFTYLSFVLLFHFVFIFLLLFNIIIKLFILDIDRN